MLWPNLRYLFSICLEGLRKIMKILSQNSQSLDQEVVILYKLYLY
jgi:hypothetical protein